MRQKARSRDWLARVDHHLSGGENLTVFSKAFPARTEKTRSWSCCCEVISTRPELITSPGLSSPVVSPGRTIETFGLSNQSSENPTCFFDLTSRSSIEPESLEFT